MTLTPEAQAYLSSVGVTVSLVQQRLAKASRRPLPLIEASVARSTYTLLEYHQRQGHVSAARVTIESVPEVLYKESTELRSLLTTCSQLGFSAERVTELFSSLRKDRAAAAGFLELSAAQELPPRHATIAVILGLDQAHRSNQLAAILSRRPQLLLQDPSNGHMMATWTWLRNSLRWRHLRLQRFPDVLLQSPNDLEATAYYLQHRLDLSIEELVLLLSCAPTLLCLNLSDLSALVHQHRTTYRLAAALRPKPSLMISKVHDDGGMARLNTLFLMSRGLSGAEVAELALKKPTLLRSQLWKD